jgi:hypothetical protein
MNINLTTNICHSKPTKVIWFFSWVVNSSINFIGSRISFLCPYVVPNNTLETNVSRYEDNIDMWHFLISVLSYISSNLNSYCMRLTISHIHAIGTSMVVELRLDIPDYELSNLILKKN